MKLSDYLEKIKTAIYGRDVRDSIVNAINECYTNASTGDVFVKAKEDGEFEFPMGSITDSEVSGNTTWSSKKIVDMIHPIGSVYMSFLNTNPSNIFGGTWEAIEGRFLLSASENHPVEETGGEETHVLTEEEMPSHKHGFKGLSHTMFWGTQTTEYPVRFNVAAESGTATGNRLMTDMSIWNETRYVGGGDEHNNMPPYTAVYMWRRTA